MENGYIKLYRSLTEWEWYKDANTMRLWMHLLLTANWKEGKFMGHTIKAGSLVTSIQNLASETGLSQQSVRTCLNHLKSTSEITTKSTNRFTLITIEKWGLFQSEEVAINKQLTNNQQTTNKQLTTIEERKKERKKEIGLGDNNCAMPKGEIVIGKDGYEYFVPDKGVM